MKQDKLSERLLALNEIMADNIELIIDELDVRLRTYGNKISGTCPIHGGNNPHAFNIYLDGHTCRGNWVCYTRHCEQSDFDSWNLIGFVQGALSHERFGWESQGDQRLSLDDTLAFIVDLLKIDLEKLDVVDSSQMDFVRFINTFKNKSNLPKMISRELVRSRLEIPPEYFLKRGFNWHILNSFDVGLCRDPTKPFFERCVVPVYDKSGRYMVGATARSIFEKCQICNGYHNPQKQCFKSAKWLHSDGFSAHQTLYNLWNAFTHIQNFKDTLIIVESPGNVWKLFEAGFPNCCAIFGNNMSDTQQQLIERSGAMNLVLALDNDVAGKKGNESIKRRLSSLFNISIFSNFGQYNDIAEMPISLIKEVFK